MAGLAMNRAPPGSATVSLRSVRKRPVSSRSHHPSMTNSSSAIATTHSGAPFRQMWAEVRAHDHVMRYRCAGAGACILLLEPNAQSSLWPELPPTLAADYRLIAPDIPAAASATAWLGDFLEGFGTTRIAVLATGQLCMPALELALRDVAQVTRLVLIPDGEADATSDATLTTCIGTSSVPLLIVRPGLAAAEALPRITQFLGGGNPNSSDDPSLRSG